MIGVKDVGSCQNPLLIHCRELKQCLIWPGLLRLTLGREGRSTKGKNGRMGLCTRHGGS